MKFFMKSIFGYIMVGLFLSISIVSAEEPSHWLIGKWTGQIEGIKANPDRMFRVQEVLPEGTTVGLWGTPPDRRALAEVKVDGAQVKIVVTSTKSKIDLSRSGDDELTGTFVSPNGQDFPIKLSKNKLSKRFDAEYAGQSKGAYGCGHGVYKMTVKDSLITGVFQWGAASWRATSGGYIESKITGEVGDDGAALIEVRGPARNSRFTGTFSESELTAIDPPVGKRQCSFVLNATRQ
jgi:hypothetical protein